MKASSLVCMIVVSVLLILSLRIVRVKAAVEDIGEERFKAQRCQLPLGMEDGRITDYQITASSNFSLKSSAHRGRLGTKKGEKGYGAWSSKSSNSGWLQVDLGDVSMVTKVATQGRQDADQWIQMYRLMYSIDGIQWAECRDANSDREIFSGNSDRDAIATNILKPIIYARYVRFVVTSAHGHASMRVEVYGCRNVQSCSVPLGMEDKRIPDTAIKASNYIHSSYPRYGRLNLGYAWCTDSKGKYLQIDLGEVKTITKVATQGYQGGTSYVTAYQIEHSIDGIHWVFYYTPNMKKKSFPANNNYFDIHTNTLENHIIARYVRIWPQAYAVEHYCLRAEFYGCKEEGKCSMPLGVQDGRVNNDEMTASSAHSDDLAPYKGRINTEGCGWLANVQNKKQWLQIDLRTVKKVTAVVTQGEFDDYWVTAYKLNHSVDAVHWVTVKKNGIEK
ncbi:lactadherin-like, partial [Actinia tenebrosa]|uniref:Lactadherin-like n=1 Tax=Actinia tenebrosa TaxID=6105 RepID=A0A6P8HH04_ACTTE